ncbi:MAG: hypothetical protein ACLQOO_25605 [Terriglobia bacterium]
MAAKAPTRRCICLAACRVGAALSLLSFSSIPVSATTPADTASSASLLETGYREMYDLQFDEAHQTFQEWERSRPDDPFGPTSDAAAYLFSEFDRLGILQLEFFMDDGEFRHRARPTPDPKAREAFDSQLKKSTHLADSLLARTPQDKNALFAKTLDLGLRSDYSALIEKRYVASLRDMKSAGLLAEQLLKLDPTNYDAYVAVGVENYMLGLKPAPMRWLLRMYGTETDKQKGIAHLRLTAEKGHYLAPFARLLLAVAALRDKDRDRARQLLQGLATEFPHNGLYARELARLQPINGQ